MSIFVQAKPFRFQAGTAKRCGVCPNLADHAHAMVLCVGCKKKFLTDSEMFTHNERCKIKIPGRERLPLHGDLKVFPKDAPVVDCATCPPSSLEAVLEAVVLRYDSTKNSWFPVCSACRDAVWKNDVESIVDNGVDNGADGDNTLNQRLKALIKQHPKRIKKLFDVIEYGNSLDVLSDAELASLAITSPLYTEQSILTNEAAILDQLIERVLRANAGMLEHDDDDDAHRKNPA